VTLNVAFTLAPGVTGSLNVIEAPASADALAERTVHLLGVEMLKVTPTAVAPVVFVKVCVTTCADLGVKVVIRDRLTRCTSYLAATMLACTASVVASAGYPIVIAP
jgi:Cys-tRNA synthase (O-phospho-L-seryl-tRNA:Cys-tRNA synthase)